MFQTKVSEVYIQQQNQKSNQDKWLEEELRNANEQIQKFKSIVTISSRQDLINSFSQLSDICDILRNEDLDPEHYEQLQKAIKQFLLSHVKDMFKQSYKQEYITQQELLAEVMMIPKLYGRLYLSAVVAAQNIQQIQICREKLYDDEDYERKLKKLGLPTTQRELRQMIQQILIDLNTYAVGIQEPVKHIFYRQFMFEAVQGYIDLELDEENRSFQTSKDYIMASNFMLENYIECNRLWCRTAYDPARTKNETYRRDKKRKYLADIISSGLIKLVNYCIYDPKRSDIIVQTITKVAQSNDSMAACTILDSIVEILPPECIAENVSKILYPISEFTSGVNTFIKISTKLQENNLITEKIYGKIVKSGTVLCQTLIQTEKEQGLEEVIRLINLGKKFESEVETPWLAIWKEILLMAGKVFSDDIDRMNEALEEVISVIYKGTEGRIQELADRISGKYVEPHEEEQQVQSEVTEKSKKQRKSRRMQDSDSESDEQSQKSQDEDEQQEEEKPKQNKLSIDELECMEMNVEAERSLMKVMSAPLTNMNMNYISQYLTCPSIIILRHHIQKFDKIIDIRFCEEVAINLVRRPILKPTEKFILERDDDAENNQILADALLTMADDDAYEFSQALQCSNISLQVYNMYESRVQKPESHQLIVISLFNALLRDNYIVEAIKCVDFMTPGNSYQQPVLYQEACNLECKIIKGEIASIFKPTFDDLYDLYCKLIISYENAKSTKQQPQILLYLLGLLNDSELPSGEEQRILKRYQAACYNLMIKSQQPICYLNLAKIYQKYFLFDQMKECLQIAEQMNERYGTEESKQYFQIAKEELNQQAQEEQKDEEKQIE